eukprot:1060020-Amphidinium_carterae.1
MHVFLPHDQPRYRLAQGTRRTAVYRRVDVLTCLCTRVASVPLVLCEGSVKGKRLCLNHIPQPERPSRT